MKTRSPMKKLAAAVVAASALVGCSAQAPSTSKTPIIPPAAELSSPAYQVLVEESEHSMMAEHHKMLSEHHKKLAEFLAKLNLSEEQKTKLKGVIKSAFARAKALQAEYKPLVTAKTIERPALHAAIAAALKADANLDTQTLSEVREILTPEQRTMIAEKLMEMEKRKSEDDAHTKMFEKLMDKAGEQITMTEAQKSHFTQLRSSFLEFWKKNRAEYYMAMGKFMTHDNRDELRKTLTRLNESMPTNSVVEFMASLDQSQRQALAEWKEKWMESVAKKLTEEKKASAKASEKYSEKASK